MNEYAGGSKPEPRYVNPADLSLSSFRVCRPDLAVTIIKLIGQATANLACRRVKDANKEAEHSKCSTLVSLASPLVAAEPPVAGTTHHPSTSGQKVSAIKPVISTATRYAVLSEQEASAATADVCRKHGMNSAALYKRKAKLGGLDVSDARRSQEAG